MNRNRSREDSQEREPLQYVNNVGRHSRCLVRNRARPLHAAAHPRQFSRRQAGVSFRRSVQFGRQAIAACGFARGTHGIDGHQERDLHVLRMCLRRYRIAFRWRTDHRDEGACILGQSWFKNHTAERLYPDALIDGKPASVDDAVEAAAEFCTPPTCRSSMGSATSLAKPLAKRSRWPR